MHIVHNNKQSLEKKMSAKKSSTSFPPPPPRGMSASTKVVMSAWEIARAKFIANKKSNTSPEVTKRTDTSPKVTKRTDTSPKVTKKTAFRMPAKWYEDIERHKRCIRKCLLQYETSEEAQALYAKEMSLLRRLIVHAPEESKKDLCLFIHAAECEVFLDE